MVSIQNDIVPNEFDTPIQKCKKTAMGIMYATDLSLVP